MKINSLLKFSSKIRIKYETIINYIHNYAIKKFNYKYAFKTKKQKYDLRLIITEIIYFLKSGVSYDNYRGPINAKTLNTHILFFSKNNIFENVYNELFDLYTKNKIFTKFKYQSTDTSFIINKNGKQKLGRNKFCKNKKCYKLSFIIDAFGIPNSVIVEKGNKNDVKIAIQNTKNQNKKIKHINAKVNPYIFADKMYDTKEFRNICTKNNYKPIIDYNKRNIKNQKLLKKLTKKEKQLYKKRIKVENSFCLIKKYKRLQLIYDSYFATYLSFINLALCIMIHKYI